MWKLEPPDVANVIQEMEAGLGPQPAHTPTDLEKAALQALYQRYDGNLGRPAADLTGEELAPAFREAIYGAYDQVQDKRRLQDLRERIKLGADHCPICGYGDIQQLDHYLAKSIYRALSIYPRNLVPICATCNLKKSAYEAANEGRQLIHAYFTPLPDQIFFVAEATLHPAPLGLTVRFRVDQCNGMSDVLHQQLEFQIQKFALNRRYEQKINNKLAEAEHWMEDVYVAGGEASLRAALERAALNYRNQFGLNDWRTSLFRSLAVCQPFCDGGFRRAVGRRAGPGA